jgi:hypothetical protein
MLRLLQFSESMTLKLPAGRRDPDLGDLVMEKKQHMRLTKRGAANVAPRSTYLADQRICADRAFRACSSRI